jgi:hypothetical protein
MGAIAGEIVDCFSHPGRASRHTLNSAATSKLHAHVATACNWVAAPTRKSNFCRPIYPRSTQPDMPSVAVSKGTDWLSVRVAGTGTARI